MKTGTVKQLVTCTSLGGIPRMLAHTHAGCRSAAFDLHAFDLLKFYAYTMGLQIKKV